MILLGKVLKTHGISGHLVVEILPDGNYLFEKGDPVFVKIDGIPVPFFLSEFRYQSDDTALILFDDADNSSDAMLFVGKSLFVDKNPPCGQRESRTWAEELKRLEGFSIVDENFGETGELRRVMELPGNPVMQIEYNGKEVLVPFQESIITGIDYEAQIIHISAPDGLLDLYR